MQRQFFIEAGLWATVVVTLLVAFVRALEAVS